MSVLSREEFRDEIEAAAGTDNLYLDNWKRVHKHDELQRQRIAELEAEQKRVVATIDGMARLLGGEAPDLPRLVDEVIATELIALSGKLRVTREALKQIASCGPSTLDTASRIARRALADLAEEKGSAK